MTEVTDAEPAVPVGERALEVDADRLGDARVADRPAEVGVAPTCLVMA